MHLEDMIICPGCGATFSAATIPGHPEIEPIGMQLSGEIPDLNFYYFTHMASQCLSTFAVPVELFIELIDEPVREKILAGGENCERHCLKIKDLQMCHAECRYAPFRRFLLSMRSQYAASNAVHSSTLG